MYLLFVLFLNCSYIHTSTCIPCAHSFLSPLSPPSPTGYLSSLTNSLSLLPHQQPVSPPSPIACLSSLTNRLSLLPYQQAGLDCSEEQCSTLVMVIIPGQVQWLQALVVLKCHVSTVLNEEGQRMQLKGDNERAVCRLSSLYKIKKIFTFLQQ